MSWRDSNGSTTYGVDKLDLSAKYSGAYLTTRIIMTDRMTLLNYNVINIAYRSLPTNTTFNISAKVNNGSMTAFSAGDCTDDIMRQIFVTEVDINNATKVQVKIAPTVSGNTAPEIEAFEILLNN